MADCLTRSLFVAGREVGTVQQDMKTGELTLTNHSSAITDLKSLVGTTVTLKYG